MVRFTFSPARAWRLAVGPASTRTLGCAKQAVRCASSVSACRRELNSLDAAKPRAGGSPRERGRPEIQTTRPQQLGNGRASAATNRNDMEPQCHIELPRCVGGSGLQSVHRAATSNGASHFAQWLRLEYVACHGCQRGAGSSCGRPRGVTRSWQAKHQRSPGAAQPNPSFKPSPNGEPPGPGNRYGVHFLSPGPGVPPSVPA